MGEAPAEDAVPDKLPKEGQSKKDSDHKEDQGTSLREQQHQQRHLQSIHQEQQQYPQWSMPLPPPAMNGQPMPVPVGNPALLQYYEAQMRDHAAAYASAAAAAAMTAAQIAADIASSNGPPFYQQQQHVVPMSPMHFPESPQMYQPQTPVHQNFGQPYHHQQTWMETHPNPSSNNNQNGNFQQRRRKRQQRGPAFNFQGSDVQNRDSVKDPGAFSVFYGNGANRVQQGQQKRGRRRRRFWNDAGSSDSGEPSSNQGNDSNEGINNRHCRRTRKMAKATSSSSESGSASWITKKKQRQPNDDSLLGKTGVSALYEWCTKRRTTPTFSMTQSPSCSKKEAENSEIETQEHIESDQHTPNAEEGKRRRLELEHDYFETTVSIDGIKMGTGRGPTKTSAKHDASRRALLTLLPGVEFDEDSGILIRLPSQGISHARMQQKMAAITSLEDLAPNLAKHLAIGHSNDDEKHQRGRKKSELTPRDSRKRQKWPHVYPGTSTTSDDEDENSYYASRGAYVCSSLLHAMVQIDERLTEPPEFTYQVSAITNEVGGQHLKLKRKAGVPIDSTSTAFPRGTFQCTGILKLRINPTTSDTGDDSFDETPQHRECYRLLRSSGVGGTKREARHTAAAKLLAMLFPECDGMADVKQAAEAAREKYAASRALKQQSKREALFTGSSPSSRSAKGFSDIYASDNIVQNLMFERVPQNTPAIPAKMKRGFLSVLGGKRSYNEQLSDRNDNDSRIESLIEAGLVRQLSRQQQLEEETDLALQKLNEQDDEGRSLPEELTADDVGRTVLRRARANDTVWVEKLFRTKTRFQPTCDSSPLFETVLVSNKEPSSRSMRLWSSSTIVLLLCRAIAPHEDPPLGCAFLTVGFSLQKGKTLRIAQIASKSHQPRERFIETLSLFAKNMDCSLITSPPRSSFATLDRGRIQSILDSPSHSPRKDGSKQNTVEAPIPREGSLVKPSLQAVQEEVEGLDESDSSSAITKKEKRREKPSKRSRFQ